MPISYCTVPTQQALVRTNVVEKRSATEARHYLQQGKGLAEALYRDSQRSAEPTSFAFREWGAKYYVEQKPAAAFELSVGANPIVSNDRAWLGAVYSTLRAAELAFPPAGQDFEWCARAEALAFVANGERARIHVCHDLAYGEKSEDYLAQTLVHEAVHAAGVVNECVASRVELAVMRQSPVGLVYRNGYWVLCDLMR